jgi:hypothetical protein
MVGFIKFREIIKIKRKWIKELLLQLMFELFLFFKFLLVFVIMIVFEQMFFVFTFWLLLT